MKLPFKIPSIKLPKFGKKKTDDDEDDDDDFDPSDFEGDDDAPSGEAAVSPADEGRAEGSADEETASEPATESGTDEGKAASEPDGEASCEPGDDSNASEELEDIDFGDDDDDDDDEEGGGKSKRKMLVIGGGATAALLLIGGAAWYFMSGDGEAEKAAKEETGIPTVTMDIAPKKKALGANSLNAIAAGATGPGSGVLVAAMPAVSFATITPPAVTDAPLAEGNDPALSETSPQGPLPIISEDGRMSWNVYAKPFENQDARPQVSIVVSGLGLSAIATDAAIQLLPGNVTLAFDPYAPGLLDWIAKARQAGHEALIMLRMVIN